MPSGRFARAARPASGRVAGARDGEQETESRQVSRKNWMESGGAAVFSADAELRTGLRKKDAPGLFRRAGRRRRGRERGAAPRG